jgi:acetyl-CoA carboxylase carboxyltransferase component
MSWEKEVEEIKRRRKLSEGMGGPEKLKRQKDGGKLNVRERIAALVDKGSFREVGQLGGVGDYDAKGNLTAVLPANILFGRARIEGRPVVVQADDFTVRGGAADASLHGKLVQSEKMAGEYRMPLVRLIEGTGGGGSVKSLEKSGYTYVPEVPGWEVMVDNLSRIPVVALGLGPVAGLGAGRQVMAHYSVLVKGLSQMFVAGPPVVAAVGEKRTKEELGGSTIHAKNGAIDDEADSEADAFAKARRFLSYLPSSVYELSTRTVSRDKPDRREASLIEAVPRDLRNLYKIRPIIEAVVDSGSFFEIGRQHGPSVATGFARLDGYPVGIMASDPMVLGGLWTSASSRKVERFVDLCDTFHLPIVHLVDVPGFLIGRKAEDEGTIRFGSRAMMAIYQAKVPICAVILRKAYGMAGSANINGSRTKWRFAWPSGDWGSLPISGGLEAAYKSDLEASANPKALLKDIQKRLNDVRSPFRTAEKFAIEDIIDPRDTRPMICEFAEAAYRMLEVGEVKKGWRC